MIIRSDKHPKVKKWKALWSGKENASDSFVTTHFRVIKRAEKTGLLEELVMVENAPVPETMIEMDKTLITEEVAEGIVEGKSRFGVIKRPRHSIEQFRRILLIDSFKNAGDLGTIIRSARCFGFDGIMLTGDSVDPWCDDTVRSAQENIFDVPVIRLPFPEAVRMLRENGVFLLTAGQRGSVPLEEVPRSDQMAVLISGTGTSSPDMIAVSDAVCEPILDNSGPGRLNITASILMYSFRNI